MANRLFILYQNQIVDYIHTVQNDIQADTYDKLRDMYTKFKNADTTGKKDQMLEFVNNLLDFDRSVIARDDSIFAKDDLLYGSYDSICLLPGIDFRPLAKIHPDKMWSMLQKMYVVAIRVLEEDPVYKPRIRRNLLNTLKDALISDEAVFKSKEYVKRVWAIFVEHLDKDPKLHKFTTDCGNMTISDVQKYKNEIADAAISIIEIAADVFKTNCYDMNVFDLRDDFIVILDRMQKMIEDNNILVRNGLKMIQNVDFFKEMLKEFGQPKCTTTPELISLLTKVKTCAKDVELNEDTIRSKVQEYLNLALTKLSRASIESSIDQVVRMIGAVLGKKL